jgi:hypothetical protein
MVGFPPQSKIVSAPELCRVLQQQTPKIGEAGMYRFKISLGSETGDESLCESGFAVTRLLCLRDFDGNRAIDAEEVARVSYGGVSERPVAKATYIEGLYSGA